MKKKHALLVLVCILLLGVGYVMYARPVKNAKIDVVQTQDNGAYPYVCEGGASLTMLPAEDLSFVTLVAGERAPFVGSVKLFADTSARGARFEGGGVVMTGAGEEIQVRTNDATLVCNPVGNQEMAPFNWGDSGEGGGSEGQDLVSIVMRSIQGKWQGRDDAKFVREFNAGATYVDLYDDKNTSSGTWVVFTKEHAPGPMPFTVEGNTVYIQLTDSKNPANTLHFKLIKLTPEQLQMVYLERGGVLTFVRVVP